MPPYLWGLIVQIVASGCAAVCVPQVDVRVGDSIEAKDKELCSNGTLTLLQGSHSWGNVVLNNAALVEGGYNSVKAFSIVFGSAAINISKTVFSYSSIIAQSVYLTNSRVLHSNVSLDGPVLSAWNTTFVSVFCENPIGSAKALQISVICQSSALITSNLMFGDVLSRVEIRATNVTNSSLTVSRTACWGSQRVALESCTLTGSNITVVDAIASGCTGNAGLDVEMTRTNVTGGRLSVKSVFGFPGSLSIVNTSLDFAQIAVALYPVTGSIASFTFQVAIWGSDLRMTTINVTVDTDSSPHVIEFSVEDANLNSSPIVIAASELGRLSMWSSRNRYSHSTGGATSGPSITIRQYGLSHHTPAGLMLAIESVNDTVSGSSMLSADWFNISLFIYGLINSEYGLDLTSSDIVSVRGAEYLNLAVLSSTFEHSVVRNILSFIGGYAGHGVVNVSNCTFKNLSVAQGVVNIEMYRAPLSISNCDFSDIRAAALHGGNAIGIIVRTAFSIRIYRTSIRNSIFGVNVSTYSNHLYPNGTGEIELRDTTISKSFMGVSIVSLSGKCSINVLNLSVTAVQNPWQSAISDNHSIELNDTQFTNNTGENLLLVKGPAEIRLRNVNIEDNIMSLWMANVSSCDVIATSCRFRNNSSPGPVVITAGNITFTNCTGMSNMNSGSLENGFGGGVAKATMIIDYNGVYRRNSAPYGNGGTFEARLLRLFGTNGGFCKALSGGFARGLDVAITKASIDWCDAVYEGGAICATHLEVNISTFLYNRAESGGTAFASQYARVIGSQFVSSFALVSGGALATRYAFVNDSYFKACTSEQHGGAVMASTEVVFGDSIFVNCNTEYGFGGALHAKKATINSSVFAGCIATGGAAIYAVELTSFYSTVKRSKSFTVGGGFYSTLSIVSKGDLFVQNEAATGGAVWSWRANFTNTTFFQNHANDSGGALYTGSTTRMVGCSLIRNSASAGGGAVKNAEDRSNAAFDLWMVDVLVSNNSAPNGGGLYCGILVGTNITFVNNTSKKGSAVLATEFHLYGTSLLGNIASEGGIVTSSGSSELSGNLSLRARVVGNIARDGAVFECEASATACNIELDDVELVQNRGGVMFNDMHGLIVSRSHFTNNTLSQFLLACKDRFPQHCEVSLSNLTFDSNVFSILQGSQITLTLVDSVFRSTMNLGREVLVNVTRSIIEFSQVIFEHNGPLVEVRDSKFTARALRMFNNSQNIVIRNCTSALVADSECRGNTLDHGNGTCLNIIDSQDVRVRNFTATGNVADFGGDIFVTGDSSLNIASSQFMQSRAKGGGALWAEANLSIEYCRFDSSTTEGGSLLVSDLYVVLALSPGAAIGFISNGNSLSLSFCEIRQCRGGYGILAVVGAAQVFLVNVSFRSNTALYGGALALSTPINSASIVTIKGGEVSANNASFGGAVFATPTVEIISDKVWSGNTAIYGNDFALRARTADIRLSYSSGEAIPLRNGSFSVSVGIGIVLEFELRNEQNETVLLGQSFEARLSSAEGATNTRFYPPLHTLVGTVYENGTVSFPNVSVTGDPGKVVPVALETELLPFPRYFNLTLAGCPALYGLVANIESAVSRGMTCVMCESGTYGYGGINGKCIECDNNMICDRGLFPMSKSGYWITRVKDGRVKAVKCPIPRLCVEGNKCEAGYNVSSLVCGECTDGRVHWNGKCSQCSENYLILLVAMFLVLIGVNLYVVFIQRTALPSPNASLKIILQFSQVALLVVPESPFSSSSVELPVKVFSGDPTWAQLMPCFIKLTPSLLFHGPGVLSAMSTIILILHRMILAKWRKGSREKEAKKATTYNSLISLFFMSVFSTTSSLLDFLACYPVFEDQRVVVKSPSILCDGDTYNFHWSLLVAYCAIAWLALGSMLAKIIIDYNKAPGRTTTLWTFMFFHFVNEYPQRASFVTDWEFYRARLRSQFCRWWQCVMLVRRVSLLFVSVLVKRQKVDPTWAFPLTLVAYLSLHLVVSPYKSNLDDITDGLGIFLLLSASQLSRYVVLCYAIVLFGSFILAGYTVYGTLARFLRWVRGSKRSQDISLEAESSEEIYTDTSSQTQSSDMNFKYTLQYTD